MVNEEEFQRLKERVQELEALEFTHLRLAKQYRAPARPREGMIALADGVNWDPGADSAAGLYQFQDGTWQRIAVLGSLQTWTEAQAGAYVTLTSSSATIAINLNTGNNFKHTLTENTTLAAPANPTAGQAGVIQFNQHASSPKTIAFNAFWKWPGGTAGTLTATNSAVDVMSYVVDSSAAFATCVMLNDVK